MELVSSSCMDKRVRERGDAFENESERPVGRTPWMIVEPSYGRLCTLSLPSFVFFSLISLFVRFRCTYGFGAADETSERANAKETDLVH